MKLIDIAICVNNIDPKGIGRIRCIRYNDYVGEKEKAMTYDEWSDRDPFVAMPFLPSNINIVPEVGQAVKIINYNTKKETVNQEYIAGPFTTMYDYNSQQFSQQIENTSYGVAVKDRPNIRNSLGEYLTESKNVFAKETDFGIYGKYGSDILFTENGVQLRGGKLLSKDSVTPAKREKMVTQPIYSPNKMSKLSLKKFSKKGVIKQREEKIINFNNTNLKYIVEYEFDSIVNVSEIKLYVYNVVSNNGYTYNTNYFNQNTKLNETQLKLINEENDNVSPTYTITTNSNTAVPILIRDLIFNISQYGLFYLNENYSREDIHPFYFRPTESTKLLSGTPQELQTKKDLLNKILIGRKIGPVHGLIWSKDKFTQTPNETIKKVDYLDLEDAVEQTFSSLFSDKIYLISTDPNQSEKNVNFDSLDKYELLQEDYLLNIDKNTYSMVRGDNLIRFLKKLIEVFYKHEHNVVGPYVKNGFESHIELEELLKNIENDILNTSIKIN